VVKVVLPHRADVRRHSWPTAVGRPRDIPMGRGQLPPLANPANAATEGGHPASNARFAMERVCRDERVEGVQACQRLE